MGRGAGPAAPRIGPWQEAEVLEVRPETPTARTLRLRLTEPTEHLAGQHYLLRLVAPDGYTATRSYSVASAPDGSGEIEITVELLPGGEVSTFVHEVVVPGDRLQVRGPIGGWFVWRGDDPALLLGGGAGVVPLMAMLRHARRTGHPDRVRMVVSVRTPGDLYYADEVAGPETTVVHTRVAPEGDPRPAGHLTEDDLGPVAPGTTAFVCGSSGFADAATALLGAAGVTTDRIRVERFGPTG